MDSLAKEFQDWLGQVAELTPGGWVRKAVPWEISPQVATERRDPEEPQFISGFGDGPPALFDTDLIAQDLTERWLKEVSSED